MKRLVVEMGQILHVGLMGIHTRVREAEEQHWVQCQGGLGLTRLCDLTEEHARRSKESGGTCWNDSANTRDLTPLMFYFSSSPLMVLSAVPRLPLDIYRVLGAQRSVGHSGMTFKIKR